MARSFFPDPPGSGLSGTVRTPVPGTRRESGKAPRRFSPAGSAAWITAVASLILAAGFAALWWERDQECEAALEALDRVTRENIRQEGSHEKERRVLVSVKSESRRRLAGMMEEAAAARRELAGARAEAAAARKEQEALGARVRHLESAGTLSGRLLDQERQRSALLEQNLSLAEVSARQAAGEQESRISSLDSNIITLRDTVIQRELEVLHITTYARSEIGATRAAAERIASEAESLSASLHQAGAERDQLLSEISRLRHCLQEAQQENHQLRHCIAGLECRIRELQEQIREGSQPPAGSGGGQPGGDPPKPGPAPAPAAPPAVPAGPVTANSPHPGT